MTILRGHGAGQDYRVFPVRKEGCQRLTIANRKVAFEHALLTLGDERTIGPLPALDALADEHESVAVHAERVDGDLFAVDVFPL